MIKVATVFILGAGASKPYGFPLGWELRRNICGSPGWLIEKLKVCEIDPRDIKNFTTTFSQSNIVSIDVFLEKRREWLEIGKFAIAAHICFSENRNTIYDDVEDNWYRYLWNKLIEGTQDPQDLARNAVRFISFNYDRSLEYFLHQSTKNTYGLNDEQAQNIWQQLRIEHMYGLLGKFSFNPTDGGRVYEPPNEFDSRALRIAADGIHLIPEARNSTGVFQLARDWLAKAARICFLGFGFDRLNIERLDLDVVIKHKREKGEPLPRIIASQFDLTKAETTDIQNVLCPGHNWEPYYCQNLKTLRESGFFN